MMGSDVDEPEEKPAHEVSIERAYYLGKYEVTQKQWVEVMDSNPSIFKGDSLPVENVSWNDVQFFIRKLNEMEGTERYHLPSEAEWEYACRAGTTTRYSFGDNPSDLGDYAWYDYNSGYKTHPVGQKKPNSWGLYDMHGNVLELCQDTWFSDYEGTPADGSALELPSFYQTRRVVRGGSWDYGSWLCRSPYRYFDHQDSRRNRLGFRLLMEVPSSISDNKSNEVSIEINESKVDEVSAAINESGVNDASTEINESGANNDTLTINSTTNADFAEDYDIAAANNAFAFDMYSIIKRGDEGNVFFSPHSIFSAIAICYDGAEGTTKEQIANVFYFPHNKSILEVSLGEMIDEINSETDDYELETANALWIEESFPVKEQYISNVETYYSGKVENLNFIGQPEPSVNTINAWVAEKTNDKIKNLIPGGIINVETRLIITNAIYFNGKWKTEFDKEVTGEEKFYPSENEEILVDMMYAQMHLNYYENSNAKMIELPYKGGNLSMYIVLPRNNDIEKFESTFSVSDYENLKYNMYPFEVKTWIPKFRFETKYYLSPSLSEMGVKDAFGPADFSGISDTPLAISNVIHQAFVDVQEEGTEAAAATAIAVAQCPGASKPKIQEFRADHPFMFFIEDKRTGCILFMGKVESPEYEEMS